MIVESTDDITADTVDMLPGLRRFSEQSSTLGTLPVIEGHLVTQMLNLRTSSTNEAEEICELQAEQARLYKCVLQHFPSTANLWIKRKKNVIAQPLGDVVMLKECETVKNLTILWSRKINHTCYLHYSLKHTQTGEMYGFLDLSDRQVLVESPKIRCSKRSNLTFVVDDKEKTFKIDAEGFVEETSMPLRSLDDTHRIRR